MFKMTLHFWKNENSRNRRIPGCGLFLTSQLSLKRPPVAICSVKERLVNEDWIGIEIKENETKLVKKILYRMQTFEKF